MSLSYLNFNIPPSETTSIAINNMTAAGNVVVTGSVSAAQFIGISTNQSLDLTAEDNELTIAQLLQYSNFNLKGNSIPQGIGLPNPTNAIVNMNWTIKNLTLNTQPITIGANSAIIYRSQNVVQYVQPSPPPSNISPLTLAEYLPTGSLTLIINLSCVELANSTLAYIFTYESFFGTYE